MTPEQIGNTNMWRLLEGEYVEDARGTIEGPALVRVHYSEEGHIWVQGPRGNNIYTNTKAANFESIVKKQDTP